MSVSTKCDLIVTAYRDLIRDLGIDPESVPVKNRIRQSVFGMCECGEIPPEFCEGVLSRIFETDTGDGSVKEALIRRLEEHGWHITPGQAAQNSTATEVLFLQPPAEKPEHLEDLSFVRVEVYPGHAKAELQYRKPPFSQVVNNP